VTFDGTGSTRALALYADGQTAVNDKLTLSAGGRYSSERRDTDSTFIFGFTPTLDVDARTWSAFTPKIAAQYQFTPDLMAYANISRGFKSGSFDIGNITPPVNPEFVWAYEVGVKSDALNNRLQANVAAFYYHYTDLQVAEVVATGIETANAANSRIFGTELELRALPWTGATVQLNGGWLDAKYVKFDTIDPVNPQLGVISLAGNTLSTAPRFTASLAGDQSLPLDAWGTATLWAGIDWTDKTYYTPFNRDVESQGAYALVNARAILKPANSPWSLSFWGKNLADRVVKSDTAISASFFGYPARGYLRDPRTYGVTFEYRYGGK
jgi:iron complex outermembrane receptor protein